VLAEVAAIVLIVRRADAHERRVVLAGLLAMGALVAATGWVGVAWRQYPRALEDGGLWRAASTITYANATGGLLAGLAVLALGVFVVEPGRPLARVASRLVAYVLLVGLLATASRAGIIAFAAGLAVVAVSTRGRALVHGWPVLVGAIIAIAALLPSMPALHEPRPLLACIGLTLGAVIAIAPTMAIAIVTVSMTIVLVSVPGSRRATVDALQSVRESRVSATSPDRTHELGAAVQLAKDHPITGVGPGRVDLTWEVTSPAPATMHAAYAHNEYLQVLDESGAIGLGILVAGLAAVIGCVWRARRHIDAGIFAGCAGALAALAVHSSMDFLWHVPLIPLTGAVLVGALLPDPRPLVGLDPSRGTA
jgi:O-antigen ligase